MRDVFSDYPKHVGMARKLEKHLLENFTEEKMTTQFADAIYQKESLDVENWLSSLELESHE